MDSSSLEAALLHENEIGRVILTHIHIEQKINSFLGAALVNPKYLKPMGLDYFGKVHLAICVGFPEDLKGPLVSLGNIRNDFAHKIDQKIDLNKINNFYESFSSSHKEEIMDTLKKSDMSWVKENTSWKKVNPEQKFMVLCISLASYCEQSLIVFSANKDINIYKKIIAESYAKEAL
jgi:hypothetical protein